MAVRLAPPPTKQAADCLARSQSAVFGSGAWGDRPAEMLAINPTLQLWEARSLLYACNGCATGGVLAHLVEQNHPEWILHTAQNQVVHPVGHPNEILLNFASLNYQTLWAERVARGLARERWTGVNVIDANNDPDWDGVPLDPRGTPITAKVQRDYLGHALEVTRAVIKTSGFRLAAQNGPPSIVDCDQINSTDSVSVGTGFALLTGDGLDAAFELLQRGVRVAGWRRSCGTTANRLPTPSACMGWRATCWFRPRSRCTACTAR